jgi:hypothetical protein
MVTCVIGKYLKNNYEIVLEEVNINLDIGNDEVWLSLV